MKFVRIAALPALLIATPAQAEPLSQYATTCAQKLGLAAIPAYNCNQGVAIPSNAGFYVSSFNNRIGRVQTWNPNVNGVFLCRDYNAATNTTALNGYILQNQITGDTCFFDAKPNGRAFVASPNSSIASDYWVNPENMAGECQTCHTSDPFIVTPGIVNAMRSQGVVRAGRTTRGAYNIVNSDVSTSHFSNWNNERQITGGCGPTCHLGSATSDSLAMVSMAQNQGWMANEAYSIPPTGGPQAAIGIWRPGVDAWFYFDKDYSRGWNTGDPMGQFGGTGDQPVVLRGTQCAEGVRTYTQVGVRRGNTWLTTVNNLFYDAPDEWNTFTFGTSGSPASWNGVAVSFQNNNFLVDLNGSLTAGNGDVTFSYGFVNDKPLVGRWKRGIGHRMAIYRGAGWWYLDTNGNNTWDGSDTIAQFGATGDIPFSGDFDGDGDDEIGVFRNGTWFVNLNNNFQWNGAAGGDAEWFFGQTGDIPVVSPTSWACGW